MNLSISPTRRTPRASNTLMVFAALAVGLTGMRAHARQSAAVKSDQTYSIQRVYKAGDVDVYKLKMTQKLNGAATGGQDLDVKMSVVMKETTKTVEDNGQVTIIEEYTKADANVAGQSMDMMAMMPKLTLKKDRAGKIDVSAEGGQGIAVQQMSDMAKSLMQSQAATLPTKPVKVGDTWSAEIPAPTTDADTTTKLTARLDGIEMLDGLKTLRLKTVTETTGGPQSDTKMHGEATMYLDAVSGKPVKMTSKADGTAKGTKISMEMVFEKGGPEDAKPAKKEPGPK